MTRISNKVLTRWAILKAWERGDSYNKERFEKLSGKLTVAERNDLRVYLGMGLE